MYLGNNNYQIATNLTKRPADLQISDGAGNTTYEVALPKTETNKQENCKWLSLKKDLEIQRSDEHVNWHHGDEVSKSRQ